MVTDVAVHEALRHVGMAFQTCQAHISKHTVRNVHVEAKDRTQVEIARQPLA